MNTQQKFASSALLTTAEAAEYLGLSPNTLKNWRTNGGPRLPHYAIGRTIRYRAADLDVWLAQRKARL